MLILPVDVMPHGQHLQGIIVNTLTDFDLGILFDGNRNLPRGEITTVGRIPGEGLFQGSSAGERII